MKRGDLKDAAKRVIPSFIIIGIIPIIVSLITKGYVSNEI